MTYQQGKSVLFRGGKEHICECIVTFNVDCNEYDLAHEWLTLKGINYPMEYTDWLVNEKKVCSYFSILNMSAERIREIHNMKS